VREVDAGHVQTAFNNQAQKKQIDGVVRILRLTKDQSQLSHRRISGENMDFLEILNEAKGMFGK
jgi:hypothetical protein